MKQNICKAVVYSLLTMTSVNAAAAGLFKPSSAGSNSILQSRQALAGQLNLRANRQRFDLLKGSDGKFTNQMQKFDGYSKGAMGTTGKAADLQNSSAGPNIGGGGYGYYDSSTKHLKTVISILKNSFKFLTEEDFAKINEYFAKRTAELKIKDFIPVTKQSLLEDLENLRYSYYMEVQKTNPDGQPEPLMADYFLSEETGKGFVVLLKPFFQTYNGKTVTMGDNSSYYSEIATVVLHEISHLYGVGIEDSPKNSNEMATVWAIIVGTRLASVYEICSAVNAGENSYSLNNQKCLDKQMESLTNNAYTDSALGVMLKKYSNSKLISVIHNYDILRFESLMNLLDVFYINEYAINIASAGEATTSPYFRAVVLENTEGIFYLPVTYVGSGKDQEKENILTCELLTKTKYLGYKWYLKSMVNTTPSLYKQLFYCQAVNK